MRWRRVLLKEIRPLPGHSNHSGLDHVFQDLDVVVSGHPEAIGKEVRGHLHDVYDRDFSDQLGAPDSIRTSVVSFSLSSEGLRVITSFKLLFIFINKVLVVIEKINNLLSSSAGTEGFDDSVPFRYFLRHCVKHFIINNAVLYEYIAQVSILSFT